MTDGSLLIGNTKGKCENMIKDAIEVFERLGFVVVVHPNKSVFLPSQEIIYLGFKLDFMVISLSEQKAEKVKNECTAFLQKQIHTIREVARIIGLLVSCFPAVPMGQLHYRKIDEKESKSHKS